MKEKDQNENKIPKYNIYKITAVVYSITCVSCFKDNKTNDLPTHCSLKPIKFYPNKMGHVLYHLTHLKVKGP